MIFAKILLMCFVLYLIRVLPFLFLQKEIKNVFFKSFLNYVPYVTLAVMTFPSILSATDNKISGITAFITGILTSLSGGNIFTVAIACCISILAVETIITCL